ncbi:hypothetical protein [Streptomyces sp. NBC_00094]|uniref:hypothetical protein n=1 Tax=Streptomyces sp. NBC_00094 TaxID=2903620 RepID=UPI002250CC06|nr:hypothetical protein [Streptomyces sp. NBC_00094]MCX5390466.1 hypothetical protein [Streptomyces sp. NBC_00094]
MTRRRAAAAALAALLPLAACGIQGTDVVEAGGAATVLVAPNPESRMVLYFVGPDGRSVPVAREVGLGAPDDTSRSVGSGSRVPYDEFGPGYEVDEDVPHDTRVAGVKVLTALLAGPNEAEAATGLTTALPHGAGSPHVQEEKTGGTEGRRLLRLRAPFPVAGLSDAAVRQLVCTTSYAEDRSGRAEVAVTGPDGALPTARCEP